jgi:uncharacterized protein (TIGR00369 family)
MEELRKYIESRLKTNHFISHMGLVLNSIDKGNAEVGLRVEEHHLQQNGFMHGGVTATLADVATGIAAYTCVPLGKNVVTADLKISYLNPSTSQTVRAAGKVVKGGNLLFFCEAQIFDCFPDGDKLIATATALMVAVDIPLKDVSEEISKSQA